MEKHINRFLMVYCGMCFIIYISFLMRDVNSPDSDLYVGISESESEYVLNPKIRSESDLADWR